MWAGHFVFDAEPKNPAQAHTNLAKRFVLMGKHPDWPSLRAKPTDLMKPGTVVSTMWSFSDPLREVFRSTQKPARMTVQPARVDVRGRTPHAKAQSLGLRPSDPQTQINPFAPVPRQPGPRASWGFQLRCTILGACVFFAIFGEDAANQTNRRLRRLNTAQMLDLRILIQHLNSPLPWESAHFGKAQTPGS